MCCTNTDRAPTGDNNSLEAFINMPNMFSYNQMENASFSRTKSWSRSRSRINSGRWIWSYCCCCCCSSSCWGGLQATVTENNRAEYQLARRAENFYRWISPANLAIDSCQSLAPWLDHKTNGSRSRGSVRNNVEAGDGAGWCWGWGSHGTYKLITKTFHDKFGM